MDLPGKQLQERAASGREKPRAGGALLLPAGKTSASPLGAGKKRIGFPAPALLQYAMLVTTEAGQPKNFRFDLSRPDGWQTVKKMLELLRQEVGSLRSAAGESRQISEGDAVVYFYFSHHSLSVSPGENGSVYIAGIPGRCFQKEDCPPVCAYLRGGWKEKCGCLRCVRC